MVEKQVLFRIDGKLLDALDRRLAKEGYATRNAWFREVVAQYAGAAAARGAKKTPAKTAKKSAKRAPAKRAKGRARRGA